MTTQPDDEWDDLLPDELLPDAPARKKGKGVAKKLVRTPEQEAKIAAKAAKDAAALAEQAAAAQLAQIVNLHIAGHSFDDIGRAIGATGDEVDQLLQRNAQRYVRSQPALRVYVRNYLSKELADMLEANRTIALDTTHADHLEHQDRNFKAIKELARLHGAEAPVQSEVKVDAAPENIDRMVQLLSQQAGRAYDMNVFDDDDEDTVDAEIVDAIIEEAPLALDVSRNAIDSEEDPGEWYET